MVTTEIQVALEALQARPALLQAAGFARRAAALDELEVHVLHRLADLPAADPVARVLRRRAAAWQARLEAVDQRLFRRLQAEIRAGRHAPAGLRALLTA